VAGSTRSNVLRETLHGLRPILSFSVLISLVYGILKLAGPLFMILIFDRVLPSQSGATLVSLLLLLVIIIAVMTLLDYSRRRILARFGAQFQERIEDHIFSATARDAYLAKGGSKPATGLNEADQLRGFFHSGSLVVILDFFWSPVFLAVVFLIAPMVGWVVVVGVALLAIINTLKIRFETGREERRSEASDRVGDLKDTLLASRHVIESQQMMAAYNNRWVMARRQSRDAAVELKDWGAWFSILSSHTALLIQYAALAAGAYLTIKGELTIGAMVASMYLARHVLHPAERFLKQVPSIREAAENWKSLDRTLSAGRKPTATPEGSAALHLSQVSVRSPITKSPLLRNVNVEISPGSSIEIVGSSGSGKTVLAETVIGRFPRAGGKVLLGPVDVERLSITDAAKTFGYVPQRVDFISGTIEENIAGLDIEPDRDRLVRAARLAQVHDKILSLPEGYLTRIDAVGSIFSKSERHRLALARVLYPDPKLLIVDEPDTTFRDALSKSLKNEITDFLARGGILIMLTRLALKTYQPTRRFTLDRGDLREVELDQISDAKVVKGPEWVGSR
jgi:ABC-type protease/lipase transport system fused ATPase/permease subunit